jgi:apolipoprotein N-acyltransferase
MQTKRVSTPFVTDSWAYGWLAAGVVLMLLSTGGFGIAVAAWVAPVFLIRFLRSQRVSKGYWITLLGLYVAYAISWYAILVSLLPLPVYMIFIIFVAFLNSLPLLADRLLAQRVRGFTATLVYPLAVTTVYTLYNLISPMGSFGTPGYEQYTNSALVQIVSVTGLWGLTILVSWFGPVFNWAWEKSFNWVQIRHGLVIWTGVIGCVLLFGGMRLAFSFPQPGTVRVHSLTPEIENLGEAPDMETQLDAYRRSTQAINEALIAGTVREARRGAQIVLWSEMVGGGIEEDANILIARSQQVAQEEGIYIAMGLQIHFPGQNRPWENKLIMIAPSGEIVIDHDKYGATFMYNMMGAGKALQGEYSIQTTDTPYGTLAGVVCWDADFPMIVRQAGKQNADILFVANGDSDQGQAKLHVIQHLFRAIENGVSLVRHDAHSGFSVATDPYGRILAMVNLSNSAERVMVAQVPTHGVFTLYSVVGDLFGWLSVVGFVLITGWAIFGARKPSIEE